MSLFNIFLCIVAGLVILGVIVFMATKAKVTVSAVTANSNDEVEKKDKLPTSYRGLMEFYCNYFYTVGMIKSVIPNVTYQDKNSVYEHYVYPLYRKIVNDYHNVFKYGSFNYEFKCYNDTGISSMYYELRHIYNEIKKNEGLFYLIFKYDIKYDFNANFDHDINSESLQKKAVDKLKVVIKDEEDKALLVAFYDIEDVQYINSMKRLDNQKNDFKDGLYKKAEENKEKYYAELNEGVPVDTNLIS